MRPPPRSRPSGQGSPERGWAGDCLPSKVPTAGGAAELEAPEPGGRPTVTLLSRASAGSVNLFLRGRSAWRSDSERTGQFKEHQVVGECCISVSERHRDRLVDLIRN